MKERALKCAFYLCARFGVVLELEVLPAGCAVVVAVPVFVFAGVAVFGAVVVDGVPVVAPGVVVPVAGVVGADAG